MDFFIIANAWSAGKDNPTSKHRIALELVRQGHRVLWIEGSGMRTPSAGSSHDRLRMVRKVAAALRGMRREEQLLGCQVAELLSERPACLPEALRRQMGALPSTTQQPNNSTTSLYVLSPLFIPVPKYECIRRLNGLICRLSMRFWGWRLGFRDPVLINYVPVLAEAMRGWRRASPRLLSGSADMLLGERPAGPLLSSSTTQQPDNSTTDRPLAPRVVYHCVDRWDAFAMYDSVIMGEMDRRCCRYADLVIASAGELYDRCRAINPNTVLIPHGVDWEHFREGAQARGYDPSGGATIGFFGLLSEWVDQDLILRLAKEFSIQETPHPSPLPQGEREGGNQEGRPLLPRPLRERVGVRGASPQARIILIGKAVVDVSRLQGIPNIELSGPIPFAELPAHVATFTIGIIPFVVNDLTRSVNPIKLREMLSAGCPVVSTDLPEVVRYAGNVQIAHNPDEFVAWVRRVLENPPSPQDRRAISDSMAGETWTAKVRELLGLLHSGVKREM